jgi:hypothetical protein
LEIFWSDFRKYFCSVFEGAPHAEKRPKKRLKKSEGEKTGGEKNLIFLAKSFCHGFSPKSFLWCF